MGDIIDMGSPRSPLDPPDGDPGDDRPAIIAAPGDLDRTVTAAEDSLIARDQELFQASGRLIHLEDTPRDTSHGIDRPDGGSIMVAAEPAYIRERMCAAARWYRPDRRSPDNPRRIDPPKDVAEAYVARHKYGVRPLHGAASCPTLRPDGSVVVSSGYDAKSGLYVHHDLDVDAGAIESATIDNAIEAYDVLAEAISTFPLAPPGGESAGVAAIMSGIMRRSLPTCPIVAVTAPAAGSGKSLLVDVIAAIATGRRASLLAPGEREEEAEKRLTAALLAGDAIISTDNVERPLRGELLCMASTQPVISIRPLAASALVRIRTNALLTTTGNNLVFHGDLTRRVMLVVLDSGLERPECKRFDRQAVEYVLEHRAALVQAALIITSAFLHAGTPVVSCDPYGSYETWDRWIRRPLIWMGIPDPLSASIRVQQDDPERAAMSKVYAALADRYPPGQIYYAREVLTAMQVDETLREALDEAIYGDISTVRIAKWLQRHVDRICDGLVLRRASEDRTRTVRWTMEHIR